MFQIAQALEYIHHINIVHRDLKLNNILFKYKNKISTIKLIDFGCATIIQPNKKLHDYVGTVY